MNIEIRFLIKEDYSQWLGLFTDYQKFYRGIIPLETVGITWQRLLSAGTSMGGIVAVEDTRLVGLAHFLYHDSTWSSKKSCYLEDLFVDKSARGEDVGRLLIEQVERIAKENEAFRLYLHTQAYNGSARSLYDAVIPLSSFIVYRKSI